MSLFHRLLVEKLFRGSPGAPPSGAPEKSEKKKGAWDEVIKTLLLAAALAIAFRSVAYEPFHIPSSSMKDTLLIGDYLFISKLSYGYSRYSFPLNFPPFEGRIFKTAPERGDVAVFWVPSVRQNYIKRIIGLPGDRIQMKRGVLYINGAAVPKVPDGDYTDRVDATHVVNVRRYKETLPNGRSYHVLDTTEFGDVDNTRVYTVPEAHYFMMGDNRDNSQDSRYLDKIGFIPEDHLVGRAEIILFSMDDTVKFSNPGSWWRVLRTDRFFKSVE